MIWQLLDPTKIKAQMLNGKIQVVRERYACEIVYSKLIGKPTDDDSYVTVWKSNSLVIVIYDLGRFTQSTYRRSPRAYTSCELCTSYYILLSVHSGGQVYIQQPRCR